MHKSACENEICIINLYFHGIVMKYSQLSSSYNHKQYSAFRDNPFIEPDQLPHQKLI